ncbi:MAG TPA: PHP domain-containing protein, partial [Cyclobacteriaceae bacterium]
MYLIFDTETTGVPHNKSAPITDLDNWPRLVQLAWQLHDAKGKLLSHHNYIIKPNGFDIPFKAEQVHGISTRRAMEEGVDLRDAFAHFIKDLQSTKQLVGHNIEFDISIIGAEFIRQGVTTEQFVNIARVDTGLASTEFCQLQGGIGGRLKMPRLTELHEKLFGKRFQDAHDASYDVAATARCFFGLITQKVVNPFDNTPAADVIYEEPNLDAGNSTKRDKVRRSTYGDDVDIATLADVPFVHLHLHSQYSVLQATADVKEIVSKAKECGMNAVAMTDFGNMYGAFKFVTEALKQQIKPIVGCEFYVSETRKTLKFTKDNPDKRYSQVLLAKNKAGYHNLAKLSSTGFIEGLYGIYPRVD